MTRYSSLMMRILILILLAAYSVVITAAEVYRWVDEKGEVHFSDLPHEGAEAVTLPEAQTFSAPAPQQRRRNSDAQDAGEEDAVYSSVSIVNPTPGEVLWSTGGLVSVSVSTQPKLRRGHILTVYLDGQQVASLTGNSRQTELTDVYRGEHTLRADVRDAGGRVVAKGNSVAFTVKQTSTQNPNNPNIARPTPR